MTLESLITNPALSMNELRQALCSDCLDAVKDLLPESDRRELEESERTWALPTDMIPRSGPPEIVKHQ